MLFSAGRQTRAVKFARILGFVLAPVVLPTLFSHRPAFAQAPSQRDYTISIDTSSEKLSSGSIWLYSYSWYGLEKIQLAKVVNGRASLSLDIEKWKRELEPHPNTDGYVVVFRANEHLWYRTPDIRPQVLWSDSSSAVNSLGRAVTSATGETQLVLAPPVRRHITLLYPNGRAAANTDIDLSIYLWNTNHCGFHEGLPLGTFRTDKTGTIEVLAPLVELYLDGIRYYEEDGAGPWGMTYSDNLGFKTGTAENILLKKQWQFTENDRLFNNVELRVLTAAGQPRENVRVWGNWQTNICGGGETMGQTDSKGVTKMRLNPSFTHLELMVGGPYRDGDPEAEGKSRELTDDELRELFSKHKMTIRW